MAVEERGAGIVDDEVELRLLKRAQHHNIFHDTRGRPAADTHELEAVAVKVQWIWESCVLSSEGMCKISCRKERQSEYRTSSSKTGSWNPRAANMPALKSPTASRRAKLIAL